jgi:lipopolysaccharide biosynthesis glycosyltransferase
MRDLIYYTVGYNEGYIRVLRLSIQSLQAYSTADVLVICDESFLPKCRELLPDSVRYMTVTDSKTKEIASMHKLSIFDYPDIHTYDRVLFLDSDILVHTPLDTFFAGVRKQGILYVYTECEGYHEHKNLCFSLLTYTLEDLLTFKLRSIRVFNAGCFLFVRCPAMKVHFDAVRTMIVRHTGPFFYEQSFMNVYFNKLNATDRSVITRANYKMGPMPGRNYQGFIVHFSGIPGDANNKLTSMEDYWRMFLPSAST